MGFYKKHFVYKFQILKKNFHQIVVALLGIRNKFIYQKYQKYRISDISGIINIGYNKYWVSEILGIRNIEYQKYWISEISDIRNIGYQKYWVSEISDIRKIRYQQYQVSGIIRSLGKSNFI